MADTKIRHLDDCADPSNLKEFTGSRGDTLTKCVACGRFAKMRAPVQAEPEHAPIATPPSAGYVCRDHHGQAVTWRGTGCTECPTRKKKKPSTTELETEPLQ